MSRDTPPRVSLDLPGLTGEMSIFRLSAGLKRDPAVERWLNEEHLETRSVARRWFTVMRECGAEVTELIHDGCPVACIEDAPFGYVNTFKHHLNVGFFYGAHLDDPDRLLEGAGKRMRHVKIKPTGAVNDPGLCALIVAAYTDLKMRLGSSRKPAYVVKAQLLATLMSVPKIGA